MQKLTFYDRQRIEYFLNFKKLSKRSIGKLIHRDHSVVIREIKLHKPQFAPYNAELAQKAANRKARNTNQRKLDKCKILKKFVEARIMDDWSPQQISGRIAEHSPPELKEAKVKTLCTETIYQHIYKKAEDGGENSKLYKHLRRHRPKRQKQGQRKSQQVKIPDRVSIHEREEVINLKQRYGDLETDNLEGKKSSPPLSVQKERKSMLVIIHKLKSKEAKEKNKSLNKTINYFPQGFVKSITLDNGSENSHHALIKQKHNIQTYFCDPYSAWQKGGVENTNGLIRQYIPKGTDMNTINQKYLNYIQDRLNNRPRKSLDYLTPQEVMDTVLK
jgi:IS30 family transposase